ncbi:alpha-ketoglutarate-dependent dioxygenase AlkB family protein [Frateuria defendens]|uniref:alpha-ketoglutarate-dependent dioxygenase AlkB family protein n=1 Tax=Frateuria defendens TaxID=2219559 RepID=UPI00066FDE89|nr:alpha-ketoglutarate-dependent dioxygenase AlkB [Frateuria defendens]
MSLRNPPAPAWQRLALPGADLQWLPQWLAPEEADALLAQLLDTVPWEVHRIRLFGREVASPRLSCWIGDPEAVYVYSGARFVPRPWPAALRDLRGRLEDACDARFNSVLANLYRDGHDAMGWHSDDEPELGAQPVIASLSLGAVRRFRLRRKDAAGQAAAGEGLDLVLPHGSLLRMAGDTQRLYRHALPRTRAAVGPRINLTFRWIEPAPARRPARSRG